MRLLPSSRAAASATLALALLAGLSACSPGVTADSGAATRTVTSAYGDVEVPESPERIAAVSYDTPWQLMAFDATPVAVQDYGRWIEEFSAEQQAFADGVATIGTYGEINFEAIAAATPDLIIGEAGEVDEAAFDRLTDIAPTVIVRGGARGDWATTSEETADALGEHDVWVEQKAQFEQSRDRLKKQYADVIAGNSWVHFSLGDDASQFSVQQPTGATGNLLVNELGATYGPNVPTDYADNGYGSYPLEQLGTIFEGVSVALTFENADGSPTEAIQAIRDNDLFQRLAVAQEGRVFTLSTSVVDYVSATQWLDEVEKKVLAVL